MVLRDVGLESKVVSLFSPSSLPSPSCTEISSVHLSPSPLSLSSPPSPSSPLSPPSPPLSPPSSGSLLVRLKGVEVDVYLDQPAGSGKCHWKNANELILRNVR